MKYIVTLVICICLSPCLAFLPKTHIDIDPIVGHWQIVKTTYYFSDASTRSDIPVKCSNTKIFSYLADGTLKFYQFDYNPETDDCTLPSNDYIEGTWKKGENGNYIRSFTHKYNTKVRSHAIDSVGKFVFSNDHNNMTQILNFVEFGIAMDEASGLIEEQTFFIRVK